MQAWIDQNFFLVFPFFFVGLWVLVSYWIALVGGWRLLANRFRIQGTFRGQTWSLQSARMRWSSYSSVLIIGSNKTGLFIVPFILFRAWHPPLFIPWTEITVSNQTQFFFLKIH
jgi:hypothetical protein